MAGNKYITKDLVDDGIDLYYKGVAIPLIINLGNIRYVSKNGNDTTGKLGRIDRPYLTIGAAMSAGNALGVYNRPETIYVLPGTYTEDLINTNPNCNFLLFLDNAKLVGNINYGHGLSINSNGTGHIVGKILARYLTIRNLFRIENTNTVLEQSYHPSSFLLENVEQIHQTAGTGTMISGFALNTNVIRNVGYIRSETSNIFQSFRGKLENIGRIESMFNGVGTSTEEAIEAYNVYFKSPGVTFSFRNQVNFFRDCVIQSTLTYNVYDVWNAHLTFENCKFHGVGTYHFWTTGPAMNRFVVRDCQWNLPNFIQPGGDTGTIAVRSFALNEYNSDLIIPNR